MSSSDPRRSYTGKHNLITARKVDYVRQTSGARLSVLALLFGKGTVIYRIWPAIFIHTAFSAVVVYIDLYVKDIGIGTVFLTIIPMVLGFVIALRVTTGYDRYWAGRMAWSDVTRNLRTMSRLIWYHVPARLTPGVGEVPLKDVEQVIEEKKIALDLLEAYAVALKHHLRDEPGPYYEDLNPLLASMETSPYHEHRFPISPTGGSPTVGNAALPSDDPRAPLLPSSMTRKSRGSVFVDLIPFASWWTHFKRLFTKEPADIVPSAGPLGSNAGKHVVIAGGGGNIPLEVIRCLSEWFSALEQRNTVPGTTLGGMIGLLQGLEDSLVTLERIITTPLPLVYTAHIRHTVWIFLFTMPFQLCNTFEWVTVPGVAVAAFLYLGFVAAAEEIEQPFGYDRNDLDLDFFCSGIIGTELDDVRAAKVPNSYLSLPGVVKAGDLFGRGAVIDAATQSAAEDVKLFDPAHPLNGVPSTSAGGY